MSEENEVLARPEPKGVPGKGKKPHAMGEVYIPDYVMHDFGLPRTESLSGEPGRGRRKIRSQ